MKKALFVLPVLLVGMMLFIAGCGAGQGSSGPTSTFTPGGHVMHEPDYYRTLTTLSPDILTATLCSIATDYPGGYVLLYDLFGTPTPTTAYNAQRTPIVPTTLPTAVQTYPVGDAARGAQLFAGSATCSTCHRLTEAGESVGPSLKGIALRAATRRPSMGAEQYIRSVILAPDQSITPLTKPGIMPPNFAQTLSSEQISDLVAYLMTLK